MPTRILRATIRDIQVEYPSGRAYLALVLASGAEDRLYADQITTLAGLGVFSQEMHRIPGSQAEFTFEGEICVDIQITALTSEQAYATI